jgi:ABC-type Na+ transport system ATPase subunit NatA
VILLHHGKVLADGAGAEIVAAQRAQNIGEAFERLTTDTLPLGAG